MVLCLILYFFDSFSSSFIVARNYGIVVFSCVYLLCLPLFPPPLFLFLSFIILTLYDVLVFIKDAKAIGSFFFSSSFSKLSRAVLFHFYVFSIIVMCTFAFLFPLFNYNGSLLYLEFFYISLCRLLMIWIRDTIVFMVSSMCFADNLSLQFIFEPKASCSAVWDLAPNHKFLVLSEDG